MRAVTVLACLALALFAGTVAADEQAAARSVEDRWKNCSQIVHGRLGALHSVGDSIVGPFALSFGDYTINWSPCVLPDKGSFLSIKYASRAIGTVWTFDRVKTADGSIVDVIPTDARLIGFHMPETVSEVATVNMTYVDGADSTIVVTALCNGSATKPWVSNLTIPAKNGTTISGQMVMVVQTVEACPRFPYTNKALPAGGVAALIIVIVVFVIQFAVCAKYHKDHKHQSPMDVDETMQ